MPHVSHQGAPGHGTKQTATPRRIRASSEAARYTSHNVVVDGSKARDLDNTGGTNILRAGTILGKVTASGKYAASVIGTLAALHDTSAVTTSLTLTVAQATELNRRTGGSGTLRLVGPATVAGSTVATEEEAFTAINTSTGVVTLSSATAADFAVGSLIQVVDGSEAPMGFIDDSEGLRVDDYDGNDIDAELPDLLMGGEIRSTAIPLWSSMDASTRTWLKATMNGNKATSGALITLASFQAGRFIFDDEL